MPPDASWSSVAAVACRIAVTAIINPDSGPGISISYDYVEGIIRLRDAGVKFLGYIYTTCRNRSAEEIHSEISDMMN
jgi:hypothetical protein